MWFLCGPENSVLAQDKLLLHHDMTPATQPLLHQLPLPQHPPRWALATPTANLFFWALFLSPESPAGVAHRTAP